jgi:membrane protease YdiL (CAAX protease family)
MADVELTDAQKLGLKVAGICGIIVIFGIAGGFGNARNNKNDSKKYNMSWGIYIIGAFLFGISMVIIWWLTKDSIKTDLNTGFDISTLSLWYTLLIVIIMFNLLFSLYSYFYLRNRVFEQCPTGQYRNIVE